MRYFDLYGLIFIVVILTINVIYSIKTKEKPKKQNEWLELFESVGRYGCISTMIFNIPFTFLGYLFYSAYLVHIIVGSILIFTYLVLFILYWGKNNLCRAYCLSILPSLLFLFSGIIKMNIPLIIFSLIFAYCHIKISILNANKKENIIYEENN